MGRLLLYLHRWAGILLALYILVIGLSGAVLVWHEDAARQFRTPTVARPAGESQLSVDQVAELVKRRFPDFHLHTIYWPASPNFVWFAEVKRGAIGKPGENAFAVYLHPSSGEVLHVHDYWTSTWQWLQILHFNLLLGQPGRAYNSILATATAFALLTGVLLWSTRPKGKARPWKIQFSRHRWKRMLWQSHQAIGLYSLAFLVLQCVTGAYFGWRGPFGKAFAAAFRMQVLNRPMPLVQVAAGATPRPASTFLSSVRTQVQEHPVTRVLFPERPEQPIRFVVYEGDARESHRASNLFFDPYSGELLRADLLRDQLLGDRLHFWIGAVHFGAFGPVAIRLLWFAGALTAPLIAITGVVLYVNRRISASARSKMVKADPSLPTA